MEMLEDQREDIFAQHCELYPALTGSNPPDKDLGQSKKSKGGVKLPVNVR